MSRKADSDVSDVEHEPLVGDSPSHLQQVEDEVNVICIINNELFFQEKFGLNCSTCATKDNAFQRKLNSHANLVQVLMTCTSPIYGGMTW